MIVKPIDVEGAAIYAVELGLWIGIMLLGVVFNLRTWLKTRKNGKKAEETEAGASPGVDSGSIVSSSRSTSVFHTVGLRRRAAEMLKLRRREASA